MFGRGLAADAPAAARLPPPESRAAAAASAAADATMMKPLGAGPAHRGVGPFCRLIAFIQSKPGPRRKSRSLGPRRCPTRHLAFAPLPAPASFGAKAPHPPTVGVRG